MVEKSRRPPKPIPPITQMSWDRARVPLFDFLASLWEGYSGLPAPHASTHKGGTDDVSGSGTPSEIAFGVDGDAGDATEGFSPFGHVHALSAEMEGLESLTDVDTDSLFGTAVHDIKLRVLLEKILLALQAIEKQLRLSNG